MFSIYDQIKRDIKGLKKKDHSLEIFGAKQHKYTLNPALSEDYILNFEKEHEITLPADYRLFLKKVGNGGAGPYYGMFKLEDYFVPRFFDGSDAPYVGKDFLQTPFLYSKNNPFMEGDIDDDMADEEYARISIREISGAITLAHQGCGYFEMLIVSGEEKGTVWLDGRCSDMGMMRTFDCFTDWYSSWLKASVEK